MEQVEGVAHISEEILRGRKTRIFVEAVVAADVAQTLGADYRFNGKRTALPAIISERRL